MILVVCHEATSFEQIVVDTIPWHCSDNCLLFVPHALKQFDIWLHHSRVSCWFNPGIGLKNYVLFVLHASENTDIDLQHSNLSLLILFPDVVQRTICCLSCMLLNILTLSYNTRTNRWWFYPQNWFYELCVVCPACFRKVRHWFTAFEHIVAVYIPRCCSKKNLLFVLHASDPELFDALYSLCTFCLIIKKDVRPTTQEKSR